MMAERAGTYHHGDLRAALIDAVLAIARESGTEHLSLRAVTRHVGVAPNAAYRHFDDFRALTVAAALVCQERVATAMREQTAALSDDSHAAAEAAVTHLRGVGLGYVHFAIAEPGWFELALRTFDADTPPEPSVTVEHEVPAPFRMLVEALDSCVAAGVLTTQEREHAEWPCWSAVHGFADIATRGPLKNHPPEMLSALGAHVVDRAIAGLHITA